MSTDLVTLLRDFGAIFGAFSFIASIVTAFAMKSYQSKLDFHSYRFTKVYDRQINVIIKSHRMLTTLQQDMMITRPLMFTDYKYKNYKKEEMERRANAAKSYYAFRQYYSDNSILLPKITADKIERLITSYQILSWEYLIVEQHVADQAAHARDGTKSKHDEAESLKYKKHREIFERVQDIEMLVDQLREDFWHLIRTEKTGGLLKKGFLAKRTKQTKAMSFASKGELVFPLLCVLRFIKW